MMNDRARPDSVRPDEPACRQAGRDRQGAGASDARCSIRASHVAALPSSSPALSLSKGPRLFLLRTPRGLALSDNSTAPTQGGSAIGSQGAAGVRGYARRGQLPVIRHLPFVIRHCPALLPRPPAGKLRSPRNHSLPKGPHAQRDRAGPHGSGPARLGSKGTSAPIPARASRPCSSCRPCLPCRPSSGRRRPSSDRPSSRRWPPATSPSAPRSGFPAQPPSYPS